MVIIFTNDKARKHLLEKGYVYTFRRTYTHRKLGRDWMTDKRGGSKLANVHIRLVAELRPVGGMQAIDYLKDGRPLLELFLKPLVTGSGFSTASEWADAIKGFNHRPVTRGWVYQVSLL